MDEQNIKVITNYLLGVSQRAVTLIVSQAQVELSDYKNRDISELTKAVETSYINWCETMTNNDFSISIGNSQNAIKKGIDQKREPAQIARTPWIICEVALKLLSEAVDERVIKAVKQTSFESRAKHLTTRMSTMGQLTLVTAILNNVTKNVSDKQDK